MTVNKHGIPVVSIVAYSGTGKTTYLEHLIPKLLSCGIKAAVIKHDGHDFTIDQSQKDTCRFKDSGALIGGILSARHAALMFNYPIDPVEFINQITGVDLILTEGFKYGPWSKILLRRTGADNISLCQLTGVIAVVTDERQMQNTGIPVFILSDADGMAHFLSMWLTKENHPSQ